MLNFILNVEVDDPTQPGPECPVFKPATKMNNTTQNADPMHEQRKNNI